VKQPLDWFGENNIPCFARDVIFAKPVSASQGCFTILNFLQESLGLAKSFLLFYNIPQQSSI